MAFVGKSTLGIMALISAGFLMRKMNWGVPNYSVMKFTVSHTMSTSLDVTFLKQRKRHGEACNKASYIHILW